MTAMMNAISPQQLAATLQQAGYRAHEVNHGGTVQIHSAAQGIGFVINFGNQALNQPGEYVDFAFICTLNIDGEMNAELVDNWNRSRRFARLSRSGQLLVLTMDVMVAGGVSADWLRAQSELWDALLREYLRHLQTPSAALAA